MAASPTPPNPNAGMSTSAAGKQRLANRERLVLGYYDDGGKGKGNCTFGYGTKVSNRPCNQVQLETEVTREMAESELSAHIRKVERDVLRLVNTSLNQEQFDALVSYVYNVGTTGAKSVFAAVNASDLPLAAQIMKQYVYATQGKRKVLMRGLVSRRNEESAPFEMGQR